MPAKYKLVLRKDMHNGAEVETKTATPRRCRLGLLIYAVVSCFCWREERRNQKRLFLRALRAAAVRFHGRSLSRSSLRKTRSERSLPRRPLSLAPRLPL